MGKIIVINNADFRENALAKSKIYALDKSGLYTDFSVTCDRSGEITQYQSAVDLDAPRFEEISAIRIYYNDNSKLNTTTEYTLQKYNKTSKSLSTIKTFTLTSKDLSNLFVDVKLDSSITFAKDEYFCISIPENQKATQVVGAKSFVSSQRLAYITESLDFWIYSGVSYELKISYFKN